MRQREPMSCILWFDPWELISEKKVIKRLLLCRIGGHVGVSDVCSVRRCSWPRGLKDFIKIFMLTCPWRSAGLLLHSDTTHPGLFNLSYRTSCLMSLGLLHWPRGVDKPHLLLPSCPPVRHLPDNSPCLAVMSAWHLVKKNRDMIARKVRAQGRGPHVGPTVTCCSNFNLGVGEREMVVFLVLAYVCKRLH